MNFMDFVTIKHTHINSNIESIKIIIVLRRSDVEMIILNYAYRL